MCYINFKVIKIFLVSDTRFDKITRAIVNGNLTSSIQTFHGIDQIKKVCFVALAVVYFQRFSMYLNFHDLAQNGKLKEVLLSSFLSVQYNNSFHMIPLFCWFRLIPLYLLSLQRLLLFPSTSQITQIKDKLMENQKIMIVKMQLLLFFSLKQYNICNIFTNLLQKSKVILLFETICINHLTVSYYHTFPCYNTQYQYTSGPLQRRAREAMPLPHFF